MASLDSSAGSPVLSSRKKGLNATGCHLGILLLPRDVCQSSGSDDFWASVRARNLCSDSRSTSSVT
jgi:hypothetical protein